MKRRLAAYAVCILLVLQMPFPTVRAEERVYFTAAGSYVLPQADNTMPFWSGGYVYVASSIFTGAAREALNISQVLDSSQEWVVLYSGGLSLTFNLSANCALDNDGNAYYPGAIRRNGVVFVPANTVSRYFNLVYSVIEVEQGSMVWLRQPSYTMPDKLFADAAQYQLNTVYADYLRAKENTPPKGGTPDAPSRPTTPVSTEDPAAELDGKRIALCLAAGSDASAMVDALGSYDAGAALFFTPEEMTRQGETLRRVAASGQSIGILVNAGDPERTIPEQLEAGNEALFQAACCKTRLAYVQNGGAQALQEARELGFHCLRPEVDRSGHSLRNATGAQSLVQRLAGRRGSDSVWLGEDVSSAGLRAFLAAVREAGGQCVTYTETGVL